VIFVVLLFVLLTGCEMFRSQEHTAVASLPGMVHLAADGKNVLLGSVKDDAPSDEKPLTRYHFSYQFAIDTAEVSVGLFDSISGYLPREYDTLSNVDRKFPVAYVSWYDAVLFCNARSCKNGLDTVYEYIVREVTATGEVVRLSGLVVRYDHNGYRLPTEAEWVYAARGSGNTEFTWGESKSPDTAGTYAWYATTSQLRPHRVATLHPGRNALYDMAGNVAEMVSEDYQPLSGLTTSNYVGTCSTVPSLKITKGGSFYHDIRYLRTTGRSDLYYFDATTRNRYTGFRCVAGAIHHPVSQNGASGDTLRSNPVTILPVSMVSFFGTKGVKVVFVNRVSNTRRLLCYIDYAWGTPKLREFTDDTTVNNPAISPDGEWVAWSDGVEGASAGASIFLRHLGMDNSQIIRLPDSPACVPRWIVDPTGRDTALLYVTSSGPNDLAKWRSEQTRKIRFSNGACIGTPEVVSTTGAFHGGISGDGVYCATGSPLLRMKKLTTGEERILFYAPLNGKPPPDTSQVCNVSITPAASAGGEVLFLDFGTGKTSSTLTGTSYGAHEYIFRADFSGTVLSWYKVPQGYSSWDHTEWSSNPTFAVSSVTQPNGAHRALFAVNLDNSQTVALCEGTDLCQPHLWISPEGYLPPPPFNPDSLGQYDTPHLANSQGLLAYKMRLFWHYADSLDVVFVGSSTAADGIDPRYFTNMKALNIAVGYGDIATSTELIENYIFNHCPKVKVIGISFDMTFFFVKGASIELYPTFTQSKGFLYDRNNGFWKGGLPERFGEYINAVPLPQCGPPPSGIDSLGLIYCGCLGWGSEPPPVGMDTAVIFGDVYRENRDRFFTTIERCNARGIKVLLMTFPLQPGYRKTGAYGPLGPSQSAAAQMIQEVKTYAETHPGLLFYDSNDPSIHDYTSAHFADYGHLCMDGAAQLSTRVDSILQIMLGK